MTYVILEYFYINSEFKKGFRERVRYGKLGENIWKTRRTKSHSRCGEPMVKNALKYLNSFL